MDHRIGLKVGQIIRYQNRKWEVSDVYPYIAYLQSIDSPERICVGVGDLVVGGVEPIGRGDCLPTKQNPLARINIGKKEDD